MPLGDFLFLGLALPREGVGKSNDDLDERVGVSTMGKKGFRSRICPEPVTNLAPLPSKADVATSVKGVIRSFDDHREF